MYKKALEYHPTHANTLYNYAVMLDTHCDRKEEAEVLYKKSIEIEVSKTYSILHTPYYIYIYIYIPVFKHLSNFNIIQLSNRQIIRLRYTISLYCSKKN